MYCTGGSHSGGQGRSAGQRTLVVPIWLTTRCQGCRPAGLRLHAQPPEQRLTVLVDGGADGVGPGHTVDVAGGGGVVLPAGVDESEVDRGGDDDLAKGLRAARTTRERAGLYTSVYQGRARAAGEVSQRPSNTRAFRGSVPRKNGRLACVLVRTVLVSVDA